MTKPDVFLSYGQPDREEAERLYRVLRQREVEVWWDQESLLGGQVWKREIERALAECKIIIVLLSSRSVDRHGYLQKELRSAIEIYQQTPPHKIRLIPVRLDECEPEHEGLSDIHRIDLFPEFDRSLKRLLKSLEAAGIGASPSTPTTSAGTEAAEDLLTRLLKQRRVVTYKQARRLLLGVPLSKPYSQADTGRILRAAQTSPRQFDGLEIQLDTLIVKAGRKRPGDGHFDERSYSSREWQEVFGSWPLLEI